MTYICGIEINPPVMNAAGTLYKGDVEKVKDIYGAVVTKTITLEESIGNPLPHVIEVEGGWMNSVGLKNPGLDKFLEEELDLWNVGLPVIVSVFGYSQESARKICDVLNDDPRISAVELNFSCPNIDNFPVSRPFGTLMLCRTYLDSKPLFVKLSFDSSTRNAIGCEEHGADALTLINTIPAMRYTASGYPFLGGLSGPVIKPVALRAVYEASQIVDIPIIGCGGIASREDIDDYMRAGASAVQVGSATFGKDPSEILDILHNKNNQEDDQ